LIRMSFRIVLTIWVFADITVCVLLGMHAILTRKLPSVEI
jgi:hypothetical protein